MTGKHASNGCKIIQSPEQIIAMGHATNHKRTNQRSAYKGFPLAIFVYDISQSVCVNETINQNGIIPKIKEGLELFGMLVRRVRFRS